MTLDYDVIVKHQRGWSSAEVARLVKEFADSGKRFAEVVGWEEHYCSSDSARNAFALVLKRLEFVPYIRVSLTGQKLYLIRE